MKNWSSKQEVSKSPKWWDNWLRAFDYSQPRTALRRYSVAILFTLFALLFKMLLQELTNRDNPTQAPFITFYLTVTLSAVYGGTGAGLVATFLSVILANFFFFSPLYIFGFSGIQQVINSLLFVTNGIIISLICGWLRKELGKRQKIAQENARLYQEAQTALAARNEFLSVAAHELKTPITSMKGFAQLLQSQLNKSTETNSKLTNRALHHIEEQSNKLTKLINRLLDISRLESGKLVLEKEPTDLVSLLERTLDIIRQTTNKHQFIIDNPTSLTAVVDPLRFEQVLINLLDNAVKYSPNGGKITLSLKLTGNNFVSLTLQDEGIGIAPEMRDKIFNPFFQAHNQTNNYTGLGLGLYISTQIINLHGGRIKANFPAQGGTCFEILVPANASQEIESRASKLVP